MNTVIPSGLLVFGVRVSLHCVFGAAKNGFDPLGLFNYANSFLPLLRMGGGAIPFVKTCSFH